MVTIELEARFLRGAVAVSGARVGLGSHDDRPLDLVQLGERDRLKGDLQLLRPFWTVR